MKRLFILTLLVMLFIPLGAMGAEEVILNDLCEEEIAGVLLQEGSIDNTKYYHIEGGCDIGFLPYETSSDFIYELDIRFNNEGCGFSFMKKGKWNSCIRIKDGHFALQTGGNSFTKLCEIDLDKWYHMTFLGRTNKDVNPVTYGHIILEEYDNEGKKVSRQVFERVNLRNNAATHYINAFGGCDIDNLKATVSVVTKMEMTSDTDSITSGGEVTFSVRRFWGELEMYGIDTNDITFSIMDADKNVIDDERIKIDSFGKLTVDPLYEGGEIWVRAQSKASLKECEKSVKITSGDIFTFKGIGLNEKKDKVTAVKVVKNFAAYKDSVAFVVGFYDENGGLVSLDYKTLSGKDIELGESVVSLDFAVPMGFDFDKGKVKAFALTSVTGSDMTEVRQVKLSDLPRFEGKMCVITIKNESRLDEVRKEDIIYFDVITGAEQIKVSDEGRTYIMQDVLTELVK